MVFKKYLQYAFHIIFYRLSNHHEAKLFSIVQSVTILPQMHTEWNHSKNKKIQSPVLKCMKLRDKNKSNPTK